MKAIKDWPEFIDKWCSKCVLRDRCDGIVLVKDNDGSVVVAKDNPQYCLGYQTEIEETRRGN